MLLETHIFFKIYNSKSNILNSTYEYLFIYLTGIRSKPSTLHITSVLFGTYVYPLI